MFTAVIPMLIFMRQAETIHTMRKYELEINDEERSMENLFFYIIPSTGTPNLSFMVENRGEFLTTLERIWLNDNSYYIGESVPSMSIVDIGPLTVPDVTDSYITRLTTVRGNIFIPDCGLPTYNHILQEWSMDSFTIFVMMTETLSQLHILVNNTHDEEEVLLDPPITYFDNDVENNRPGYSVSVPVPGKYYVEVTRWHDTPNEVQIGFGIVSLGLSSPTVLIII